MDLQYTVEQSVKPDGAIDVINRTSNGDFGTIFCDTPTDSTGVEVRDFVVGEIITGQSSGNKGVVIYILQVQIHSYIFQMQMHYLQVQK